MGLEEIRNRKSRSQAGQIDRRETSRRTGVGNLSREDCERIGGDVKLWDKRAATPPRKTYTNANGSQVQLIFRVHGRRSPNGSRDVVVASEEHDASLVAMDEKIMLTIATARFRGDIRRHEEADDGNSRLPLQADVSTGSADSLEVQPPLSLSLPSPPAAVKPVSPKTPQQKHHHHTAGTGLRMPSMSRGDAAKHPVLRAERLESKSRRAAFEYLEDKKTHIEELRKEAHRKATSRRLTARRHVASSLKTAKDTTMRIEKIATEVPSGSLPSVNNKDNRGRMLKRTAPLSSIAVQW